MPIIARCMLHLVLVVEYFFVSYGYTATLACPCKSGVVGIGKDVWYLQVIGHVPLLVRCGCIALCPYQGLGPFSV